ncbi:ribonuclease D [Streptococcus sp. E24BD]|uniref:ribonuclease D n=1 Tax=Streptococcus sp. E24BD TaxID=3278715 RepID=UPI00359D083D
MMNYITRIHLKTDDRYRAKMIDFCLKGERQYLAIGWSYVYQKVENEILTYQDYYHTVREYVKRTPPVLNIFKEASIDDLFWTRDLDGVYWICRAKGVAEAYHDTDLDIGAVVPVEAYLVGTQVPGQIKAAFNRARGGTSQRIWDKLIIEYSKSVFNTASGRTHYTVDKLKGNILDNLPDFDLEELVISYLQITKDYYVLSNSIANKSTTIKIECELMSRNPEKQGKAVVQVKGRKAPTLNAMDYAEYINSGYVVYLFAPGISNAEKLNNIICISNDELMEFYTQYKAVLPNSITQWENLY